MTEAKEPNEITDNELRQIVDKDPCADGSADKVKGLGKPISAPSQQEPSSGETSGE